MATKVEAEGKELIIRNDAGDIAIIPKNLAGRVQSLLDVENYEEVDNIVNSLPAAEEYAEDGSLFVGGSPTDPPSDKPKITLENENESATLFKDIQNMQAMLKEAVKNKDQQKALYIGKQLTAANQFQSGLTKYDNFKKDQEGVYSKLTTDKDYDYGTGKYTVEEQKARRSELYSKYRALTDQIESSQALDVLPARERYTQYKNLPYLDTQEGVQTRLKELEPILQTKGDEFLQTKDNDLAKEYLNLEEEQKYRQEALSLYTNQKKMGGKLKAEEGLKVNNGDPPPEGFIASATKAVTDFASNLFGSDEEATGKTLNKLDTNFEARVPIEENFPEHGLTNQGSINEFLGTEFETRKGTLKPSQFDQLGCKGGSCNSVKFRHPELKNVYDLEAEYGVTDIQTQHPDTDLAKGNNSVGIDSWETDIMVNEGMATELFRIDRDAEKYGVDEEYTADYDRKIKDFDVNNITVGTILNSGDAVKAGYIDKDAEITYKKDGKLKTLKTGDQKSRHTRTVVGFDEDNGDFYVHDMDHIYRIPRAEMSEYIRGSKVNRIIAPKNGDWTFKKLVEQKRAREKGKNKKK